MRSVLTESVVQADASEMGVRRELKCRARVHGKVVSLFGWQLDKQVLRLKAPIVSQGVFRAGSQRQANVRFFVLRAHLIATKEAGIENIVVLIDYRHAGRGVDQRTVKGETES